MRLRITLARAALLLCSTVGALAAVEIGCRIHALLEDRGILTPDLIADVRPPVGQPALLGHVIMFSANRRIIYELKPDLDVSLAGARMTTNRNGMRGPCYPRHKGPDTVRIVGLGDSQMFGVGVADGEEYLALVGDLLASARPGQGWQVVNTAVPGYNTVMEVETLRHRGLAYQPDVVIVEFVGNDLALPNFIRRPAQVLSLRRSFLSEYLYRGASRWRDKPVWRRLQAYGLEPAPGYGDSEGELASDPDRVPPEYRDHVGWEAYERSMRELRQLADEHGFAVVVVTLAPRLGPLHERTLQLGSDLGFGVLDVGEALRSYMQEHGIPAYLGSPLTLNASDGHASRLGHRIAAEAIADFLLREVLPR